MRVALLSIVFVAACTGSTSEVQDPQGSAEPSEPATPAEPATAKSPDDCPRLTEGLISLRVISQASHAAARHDVTVNFEAGTVVGDSYDLSDDDDTPRPRAIDRALTDDERAGLLGLLETLCHPVVQAREAQHSAPGGSTTFELRRTGSPSELTLVYGEGASELAAGQSFIGLSRDEFSSLAALVPTSS